MKFVKALLLSGLMVAPLVACSDTNDGPGPGPGPGGGGEETELPKIVINEVTSSGDDNIEFLNLESDAVDLSGWYYMDSKLDLTQAYVFPEGTFIQPGEYLVVDKVSHHVGFGIGTEDGISLFTKENKEVDTVAWLAGDADKSWCRMPDGTGDFQVCTRVTFGAPNEAAADVCGDGVVDLAERCDGENLGGATCESLGMGAGTLSCAADCLSFVSTECGATSAEIVINEVTSKGDDNIELFNRGSATVDLSGWSIYDQGIRADLETKSEEIYRFAEGTTLAAGQYLVLVKDVDHVFGLGGSDGVYLFDKDGEAVDQAEWPADAALISWCRLPNGEGAFQACDNATFGEANALAVCGDDAVNGAEECDGTNFAGDTCESLGFAGGELSCTSTCTLVVDACSDPVVLPNVVINEVTSAGDDNIELLNTGDVAIDLSGWYIYDQGIADDLAAEVDPSTLKIYYFAEGTMLEPGEYLVLVNGFDHQYGLGGQDGVFLFTAEGVKVDEAVWPADGAKNASWCRLPNGSGDFQVCETATFGAANE